MIYKHNQHADLLHIHLEKLEAPDSIGINTGIPNLDKFLDPLTGGDFGFVLGRPGSGKCHGRGTKIIMFDGALKNVEDIQVGDQLMGVDSTPRNVLSTTSGIDQMYVVKQNKGIDYRVNSRHILSLKERYGGKSTKKHATIEIAIEDYIVQTVRFKRRTYGWKPAHPLSFDNELCEDVDWYLIGLWIADGRKNRMAYSVNSDDVEILDYLHDQSLLQHFNVSNNCQDVIPLAIRDKYRNFLRKYNMWDNKHIPLSFRRLSVHNRLQLLAGYIDGDGFLLKGNAECIGICTSERHIRDEIVFIGRSLGLSASVKSRARTDARTSKTYVSHEAVLGGNISIIPTKLLRKNTNRMPVTNDYYVTGITVEKDTIDEYFGFQIDGDHLYLLEDCTVTHNSVCLAYMCRRASEVFLQHKKEYAPPIFITKEMAIEDLMLRNLSNYVALDSRIIRKGKSRNDWNMLHESVDEMVTSFPTIYIGHSLYSSNKRKNITLEFIEDSIAKIADEYSAPPIFVALDYLQRVSTKTIMDRRLMMSEIVERGKDWALEYNTAVLFGSQASREVDSLPFPVPTATSGKETGSIEETADWIVSVMRPAKYWKVGDIIPHTKPERVVTPDLYFLNILKQRNNEANMGVWLSMDARISELSDLEFDLELE